MLCWITILGSVLIMMGQHSRSEALFYYFRLEDQVPESHFLRLIEKHISFAFVREKLTDSYRETGRPSIDPELLLRSLLIGYLYGVTSERKLIEELRMRLAWRWFTGLGFDQEIPHHSTFSKNRHGRFQESKLFEQLFEEIVARCLEAGLVQSDNLSGDGPPVAPATFTRLPGSYRKELIMKRHKTHAVLAGCIMAAIASVSASAQAISQLCTPKITGNKIVASPKQRYDAGQKAEPPVTDNNAFFAWPDTPMGIIKTGNGYEFFGSDGGFHSRQMWQGHWVGNNKWGSVVTTAGTLGNPLGSGAPQDVSISPNPDPAVNPNYSSYQYMGGGPVYQVPAGMTGAGSLLVTYHAELPIDPLYAALGLAASSDNGLHWTDLGEIIRLNQAYEVGLDGWEIGDGPLVLSPDGKYFYLYFPDWMANGTLHIATPAGVDTTTRVSVARALASSVLEAAFGSARPHTVPFEKFYKGSWRLQPGIGGASTDLMPNNSSQERGYIDIHYNGGLQRYVMIISNDMTFYYAESIDALNWTTPTVLGTFDTVAAYPTAVGLGDDPHILGKSYYVYFTHLPTDGTGWTNGEVRRLTVSCQ